MTGKAIIGDCGTSPSMEWSVYMLYWYGGEAMSADIDIIKSQLARLDMLQDISPKPILIKAIEGGYQEGQDHRLFDWMYYKDIWELLKAPIYTRGILRNEICIDPDIKDWNKLVTELKKIQAYCIKENIPLELAYSGGNGIHGHIFFDDIKINADNFDNCKKYDIDLFKVVRNVLLDVILDGAGTNKTALALDSKKINFSANRLGSQVREYGTQRPDGNSKTLISIIPETKPTPGSLPLIFPEKITIWKVPEKFNKRINDRIREEIKKAKVNDNFNTEFIDLKGNRLEKFPCLKTLFRNGASTGSRYYGSNSITLMAKQCGLSWTATEKHIKKFFEKCEITEAEAKLRIDNNKPMFESSDYHFSCRTMKEVFGDGICEYLKCPLYIKAKYTEEQAEKEATEEKPPQHIVDKANEILDQGKAIDFLMATCSKIHIGDETTIKATLGAVGCQSIINSSGIQPKVSGGSGKGKSHAVKSVFHLVPREYVLETSLSAKALFHLNIKPGTIIFDDDADIREDIEGLIKRCTTNFQDVTKHTISVKEGSEWTAKTITIPQRVIWALTSVNDNGSLEYLNRQFNLGVDETTNQDDKVWQLLQEKAEKGEVDFSINDDVLVCREIIRDIKNHLFTVRIPYAKRIIFNDKQNRRNGAQFLDFIRAFAVFNYRLRPKTNDNTIEASESDFKDALSLYSQRATNQRLKLNDNEIAVVNRMVKGEPYTIEKLQDITGKSYRTIYNIFHGRDGKTGLLEKVPQLTYKPETEFIGDSEIINEYGSERTVTKKTKPKHVYVLTTDFSNILNFGSIASLEPEVKP